MSAAFSNSILFACTSNSVRSPIAAALARFHLGSARHVESAGVSPREIDAFAVAVMAEIGLDLSVSKPKSLAEVDAGCFKLVVCLTKEARAEALRILPGDGEVEFWAVRDPTTERDMGRRRDQILAAYREVRDEIEARILARFVRSGGAEPVDGA